MKKHDKPKEECGVFGVSLTNSESVGIVYNGLLCLQHRGQEGAGIAAVSDNHLYCRKDVGLVSEVFSHKQLQKFPASSTAVGHVRYSTTGANIRDNAGPFVSDYLTGRIAVAHNGNITNAKKIRHDLLARGLTFDSSSDSEVIAALIALNIRLQKSTELGIVAATSALRGAFSLVIANGKNKLIGVRDPSGFRPLVLGKSEFGYALASESCALDGTGFAFVRDILPGEVVGIQDGRILFEGVRLDQAEPGRGLCIFEYVYFARPDSVIDGLLVHKARHNMGVALAQEHPADADIVCGVPDSGLDAALGYSAQSGLPLAMGFVKNRYIGRSFIYPTQNLRDNAVKFKLNPLPTIVEGKRVVLVDDSIVRGTTSEKIVKSLRAAGASEVHMRISAPPFRYSCHYGTDIDNEENLIANRMTLTEICDSIGADSLGYISVEGLKSAVKGAKVSFCTACFTGNDCLQRDRKNILE